MLIEEDYGPQVASSLSRDLVMYLARRNPEEESTQPYYFQDQSRDRFAQLVAWIVRNLHEDLSVEALARRACMSPRVFSRAFKSVFGTLPGKFVENLRLNEAKRRLSTSRNTLQSIAKSVGLQDTQSFRRSFEQRFGSKPAAPFERLDRRGGIVPINLVTDNPTQGNFSTAAR